MKNDYITNQIGDYATINYSATIYNEDDETHFPYYSFSGWFLLKGDDVDKTDDEIYGMVFDHFKGCVKERYGYTLEEIEADPAFKSIIIVVSKNLNFSKQIKLTK